MRLILGYNGIWDDDGWFANYDFLMYESEAYFLITMISMWH